MSDQALKRMLCGREFSCPSGELASATDKTRADENWLLSYSEHSNTADYVFLD